MYSNWSESIDICTCMIRVIYLSQPVSASNPNLSIRSKLTFNLSKLNIEGFLYAQELVTMATKQRAQICLFKADTYKAFDTLSWEFLIRVLQAK
jgi:hypothetical protein